VGVIEAVARGSGGEAELRSAMAILQVCAHASAHSLKYMYGEGGQGVKHAICRGLPPPCALVLSLGCRGCPKSMWSCGPS
jgi:hypothetical protein